MTPAHSGLALEDLAVGDRFTSEPYLLTDGEIRAFAERYDPQPFHLDPVAAEASFFRGLAGSGWLVAAITMRLLVSAVRLESGIVGAGGEIAWPTASRPGDELTAVSSIVAIRPSRSRSGRARVTLETETLNQHGEVRQRLRADVLAFARSTGRRASGDPEVH